ncbi:MAG: glutamate--tRNA ligase [Bacteroidota bacterium]
MVRVRFAPSPTGGLHIGGVRTAYYNKLFAEKHGGTFILRIEDTDQKRFVAESEGYIKATFAWLGIMPDEGPDHGGAYGPYRQSERKAIYKQYVEELVAKGKAYYAFDSVASLEKMRTSQQALGVKAPKYNAVTRMRMENAFTLSKEEVARRIGAGVPYVVRLLVDYQQTVRFKDEVRGWVQVSGAELDDKVLLKEDGMPTYHLANVVDDHLMEISHVIRGEEWLPSMPIHSLLYDAFGWTSPVFAHLPLLLRADGKGKLSKRAAVATGIPIFPLNWDDPQTKTHFQGFREAGYLPDALLNFIALLGWHPRGHQELFYEKGSLAKAFSLDKINKAGVQFDVGKAQWFNQQYLKKLSPATLAKDYLVPRLAEEGITVSNAFAMQVCALVQERIVFPQDLWVQHTYLFRAPASYSMDKLAKKWSALVAEVLRKVQVALKEADVFEAALIGPMVKTLIRAQGAKLGAIIPFLRMAVTGTDRGPELFAIMALLGKKEVMNRLGKFLMASHDR